MAETTPTPSESSFPNGLPIAATGSPTTAAAELPSGTGTSACADGSTLIRPTSSKTSQPTILASARSWSWNSTKTLSAGLATAPLAGSVITCELVRM